jgi:hypothetical protein
MELTVMHANVHTLAGLGTMGMHGISSKEDSVKDGEFGTNSLPNSVGSPPVTVLIGKLVGM